jgi:hypothetical protein
MKQSDLYRQKLRTVCRWQKLRRASPLIIGTSEWKPHGSLSPRNRIGSSERSPIDPLKKVRGYQMSSKKWNDPQLDAAQFAIDRFLIAQQTVSEQMAEIFQSTRDGCATDEDVKRLKILREQYIALSKEVEDVMGRRLARKQPKDT